MRFDRNSRTPDVVSPETLVLEHVSHYHQSHGVHPRATQIPPYYERVELMTGGRGAIQDGANWRDVAPGDLIWNKPGDMTIGRSDFENPYRCLAVTLVTKKKDGLGLPRFSRWPNLEEVNTFVHETVSLFGDESFDRSVLRNYIVSRLLFCLKLCRHREGGELQGPIQTALEWIRRNHAGPCPIEEIARAVNWSAAHLHHAFRRHLQTTPHQVVLRERLRSARERLVSSSYPIKQIAVECGFSDAPAFTHVFKAATGLTPAAYRKRYLSLSGPTFRGNRA